MLKERIIIVHLERDGSR